MRLLSQRRTALLAAAAAVTSLAVVPGTASAASAGPASVVHARGALVDLQPATGDALDGANAMVVAVANAHGTVVVLHLSGIDRSAAGRTYGAHVHSGICVAGDGAAAGPHYNSDVAAGQVPPEISDRTEVWLDFTVTPGGTATAVAHVPFTIASGAAGAVVVHRDATGEQGVAGPRLACLPVGF